jgi:sugar phosphate isomerase/epimerase
MPVRFSVGEYTTPRLSFAEDLRVYREAGAEGIGIDASLKLRDPAEDLARFHDSGLQATFCMPAVSTVFAGKLDRGVADPVARVDAMREAVRAIAAFEPECIVLGTGPFADEDADRAFAVGALRDVVREAAALGRRVALEPLHTSLGPEWSHLTDLPGTLALIDDIGEPDVGVLFDVWHLWDTPGVRELLAANVDAVYGVHVDDWRSPTRSWCDRVLPGDGIADAAGLLAILREGGYDGWLELEIFSDDGFMEQAFPDSLWAGDPVELIRRGRERTLAAWDAQHQAMGAG